jgi:dihydroxy-acid dehydratase
MAYSLILQDGDVVAIDAEKRTMDIVGVSDADLAARRAAWTAPPLKATSGTLYKYIKNVLSASEGCVTDA